MASDQAFEGIQNLYGAEAFKRIQAGHVLVIGIGGVGSWCAESLARSGVKEISLMDMDEVCVSNINRQVMATSKSVGETKVSAMEKRLQTINPQINVHSIFDFFSESSQNILNAKYTFIVDAIDSVSSKALLHIKAKQLDIPVICIGGSASKVDASLITISDLKNSINDKLLKQLRRELRARPEFSQFKERPFNIPTVFSKEGPKPVNQASMHELKTGKVLNCSSGLGSISHITATFGFFAAGYIINKIAYPHQIIDMHTHQTNSAPNINFCALDFFNLPKKLPQYFCLGIHPWHLNKAQESDLAALALKIDELKPIALGEIGLDKKTKIDFPLQMVWFKKQLELATEQGVKRIVIHCVKAYNEIFQILTESSYPGKILFHDFNSTQQMAQQFMQKFDVCFSFGAKIFKKSQARAALSKIPLERVFFETDDQCQYSIEEIYEMAASLTNMEKQALVAQIHHNFQIFTQE